MFRRAIALAFAASLIAGCTTLQPPRPIAPAAEGPYTLDAGDRLRVVVFGQDGVSNSYVVDMAGQITMPLIGQVPARGQTPQALEREIARKLRNGFIRDPSVSVEIETYRPFFIMGEVQAPGAYPYVPGMTIQAAIAVAGGFTPRGYREHVELNRPVGGQIMRGSAPVTMPVRPGDTIVVMERWF